MENAVSKKNKIVYLCLAIASVFLITLLSKYLMLIKLVWLKITLVNLANVVIGLVAICFIKLSKMQEDYGFKNLKCYLIGFVIAIVLQLFIGVLPALLGQSLVGSPYNFVLWDFIYQFLHFILIIGPVEELIFRVYIQGTIVDLLPKNKWLGVVIAALIFGFWHIINGSLIQVLFTFLIGCVFGFCKYLIKNCKFAGVAFAHGLYDFLNVVTRLLFVK